MPVSGKTAAALLLASMGLGLLLAVRHEILQTGQVAAVSAPPTVPVQRLISTWLKVRGLRILSADANTGLWIGEANEDGSGIWMTNARKTATIEAGVHANGFPYLLVSDGAIRTFGLGRVDGVQASPILVFRSNDVVRMIFGLDMTEKRQSPFLVGYTSDGGKHDVIGHYCERPDRVCVR
jgi:hypothetical protein